MQIHELNSFVGTPGAGNYLAIDDGSETTKVEASNLGVTTQMTQAEAEAGTETGSRVISPNVLNAFAVEKRNGDINLDTSASSGDDYYLTQALTDIGWLSAVAINGKALMKKWLYRITTALNTITNELDTVNAYNVKDKITAASGVTINSAYIYVFSGRLAQLYITCEFSSAQTADTSYDIGTLATAIRPRNLAPLASTFGAGQINVGGNVSFRPQVSLQGGSNRAFCSIYLLNSRYTG